MITLKIRSKKISNDHQEYFNNNTPIITFLLKQMENEDVSELL